MTIQRGTRTIRRRHASNYIDKQADARFDECVAPYQRKGLNALGVNFFDMRYFARVDTLVNCTCQETQVLDQHQAVNSNVPINTFNPESLIGEEIKIDHTRPLFGTLSDSGNANDYVEDDEYSIDEEEEPIHGKTVDNLFAHNSDCGICYRMGYAPSYHLYGYHSVLLTTKQISESYGYTINHFTAPHTIEKLDINEGCVDFEIEIPRFFQKVYFSIRNNVDIVEDYLYNSYGQLLSLAELQANAGGTCIIRVLTDKFTHVVLDFDLGTDKPRVNIAQMTKTTDWTIFSTIGNLQVIVPMTIQEPKAGDVIYVLNTELILKVTDVNYLRTTKDHNLDWQLTTRILQNQEALRFIALRSVLL